SICTSLCDKHRQIAQKELQLFAERTRNKCQEITNQLSAAQKQIKKPCENVEKLVETRAFIATVPNVVSSLQPQINDCMRRFDILEQFNFKFDRSDIRVRWTTFAWPKNINDTIQQAQTVLLEVQKDHLKELRQQQEVQPLTTTTIKRVHLISVEFVNDFNTAKIDVQDFEGLFDLQKLPMFAEKARGLQKILTELQLKTQTFNQKEVSLDVQPTDYQELTAVMKQFEPFYTLWTTAENWSKAHGRYFIQSFQETDPFQVEKEVDSLHKAFIKTLRSPSIKNNVKVSQICQGFCHQIEKFKPHMPLIVALGNDGMRDRHWETLSQKLGMELKPTPDLNLRKALNEYKLDQHIAVISKEGEKAAKEFEIEKALDKMEAQWQGVQFVVEPHKNTKTYRLSEVDVIMQQLDEHRVATQAMQFSIFKGPFETRIADWDAKLSLISEVVDEWLVVQRNWLHLQPIFESADIMKQLPVEGKKFNQVDRMWRQAMESVIYYIHFNLIFFFFLQRKNKMYTVQKQENICIRYNNGLLLKFKDATRTLEQVQKGLSDYLNTKRAAFARFYFLSDDELLQILSQAKDVTAVQPHIKKCFENIHKLEFDKNLQITAMLSASEERFPFVKLAKKKRLGEITLPSLFFSLLLSPLDTAINPCSLPVETWLGEVEKMMVRSLKTQLHKSLEEYNAMARTEWIKRSFGQCVLTSSQVAWTNEVEQALTEGGRKGVQNYLEKMKKEMSATVEMVRGKLDKLVRMNVGALVVLDVHNLNTVEMMCQKQVENVSDFMWISQLRYYYLKDENDKKKKTNNNNSNDSSDNDSKIIVKMVQADFPYGYEYQGNSPRLVITPLTERCYMTLMTALQLHLGGAPVGPAGTGKTETVKDLAKNVAKQCVVFNCSDSLGLHPFFFKKKKK
ncbi:hypothetical protein RFI_19615, partial [Reticulomyxa filosa]